MTFVRLASLRFEIGTCISTCHNEEPGCNVVSGGMVQLTGAPRIPKDRLQILYWQINHTNNIWFAKHVERCWPISAVKPCQLGHRLLKAPDQPVGCWRFIWRVAIGNPQRGWLITKNDCWKGWFGGTPILRSHHFFWDQSRTATHTFRIAAELQAAIQLLRLAIRQQHFQGTRAPSW